MLIHCGIWEPLGLLFCYISESPFFFFFFFVVVLPRLFRAYKSVFPKIIY